MKFCTRCKIDRPTRDFRKMSASKDGYQQWCRTCFSLYESQRYQNGDKARKQRNRERQTARNIEFVNSYKVEHGCIDCGYNTDPVAIDFDHLSGKHYNVSDMIGRGFSLDMIKAEISKCEVRCANCHRIVTKQRAVA